MFVYLFVASKELISALLLRPKRAGLGTFSSLRNDRTSEDDRIRLANFDILCEKRQRWSLGAHSADKTDVMHLGSSMNGFLISLMV